MDKKTGFLNVDKGKLFIHADISDELGRLVHPDVQILEVDIMNDYDNSLNLARDFINSIDVDGWFHSSSIDFAEEYDVDQSMLDTFLDSVLTTEGEIWPSLKK